MYASFAESSDVQEDTLTDLRTGESVKAVLADENLDLEAIALPGVLGSRSTGVTARYIGGRVEQLSTAGVGARGGWVAAVLDGRRRDRAHGAAGAPRRRSGARQAARTVGKCKPRPGARLLVRFDRLVVSRAGGATWACRGTKTRRVSDSAGVTVPSDRRVLYPGGQLTVSSGRRDALGGTDPATNGVVAYALDGAGTPQVTPL